MFSGPASVETAVKIATHPSSDGGLAVDSLSPIARQRSKSSPLRRGKSESALETLHIMRPHLGVDHARRPLAVERAKNLLGGNPAHIGSRLPGHARGMRAREHVVELQQRMIQRRRFLGPDVEAGAGYALVPKCFDERALVVDKAASRRDEIRMRLHSREFAGADH